MDDGGHGEGSRVICNEIEVAILFPFSLMIMPRNVLSDLPFLASLPRFHCINHFF